MGIGRTGKLSTGEESWMRKRMRGVRVGTFLALLVLGGAYCSESGSFCNSISVGGGGGGTGGSGGGTSCSYQGYCPAECFSCGGGAPKN
jgi:hypothetical protein